MSDFENLNMGIKGSNASHKKVCHIAPEVIQEYPEDYHI